MREKNVKKHDWERVEHNELVNPDNENEKKMW